MFPSRRNCKPIGFGAVQYVPPNQRFTRWPSLATLRKYLLGHATYGVNLARGTEFGLLTIPIRLYPAARSQRTFLHQLHDKCPTRMKQPLFCPTCNRIVSRDEVVKGYCRRTCGGEKCQASGQLICGIHVLQMCFGRCVSRASSPDLGRNICQRNVVLLFD
jgi:hypothetical protein